jgi:hypothetical protein
MDSITSALRNLESRLSLALDNAQQAEHDLNRVRLQAGLPPYKFFHLSAAALPSAPVGPKGGTRLSAEDIVNAGEARATKRRCALSNEGSHHEVEGRDSRRTG